MAEFFVRLHLSGGEELEARLEADSLDEATEHLERARLSPALRLRSETEATRRLVIPGGSVVYYEVSSVFPATTRLIVESPSETTSDAAS